MRCAIYTRKSHNERTDSQLSSIERQRELCEAHIASQAGEGWMTLADRYDDLGQSGGSVDRPALTRLLADVAAGRIDTIVVYKIDRLSRSLRDFLNLIERLDRAGTTFVSVTQSFSTTTSIGRLTLNILLSFAQFERDIVGERSRDWKAGARERGLWTSGGPPFGYLVRDLRLEPDPVRAPLVRDIYLWFLQGWNYADIARRLNNAGHNNRLGREISGRMVRSILTSPVYIGHLTHRGEPIDGQHSPIVSRELWDEIQSNIQDDARSRRL